MGKKAKKKCCGKCDKKGKFCKSCPLLVDGSCTCEQQTKKNKKDKKNK